MYNIIIMNNRQDNEKSHIMNMSFERVIVFILSFVVTVLVISFIVKTAWNYSMPHLFGLPQASFIEALSLFVLLKLLIR